LQIVTAILAKSNYSLTDLFGFTLLQCRYILDLLYPETVVKKQPSLLDFAKDLTGKYNEQFKTNYQI